MEDTGRRKRRRSKQLLHALNKKKRYWGLKEKALRKEFALEEATK
jgi:hypothetical protein